MYFQGRECAVYLRTRGGEVSAPDSRRKVAMATRRAVGVTGQAVNDLRVHSESAPCRSCAVSQCVQRKWMVDGQISMGQSVL